MRLLFSAILCLALAGAASAQRGGGGGMRGGGGGMRGGSSGGGMRGGSGGHGFNGGFNGGAFRGGNGGFGNFSGFRGYNGYNGYNGYRGYGGHGGYGGYGYRGFGNAYYSNWGLGLGFGWGYGYSWPYYGYPYIGSYPYLGGYYADYGYPADYSYPADYGYAASPAVTVVYAPQPQTAPVYVASSQPERARPLTREYDQFGQEIKGAASPGSARASSPIYLFAFEDHVIRAANAYWIEGKTLHYVTLQHEEKQAPLESLDRSLTLQLNRERQVVVNLP